MQDINIICRRRKPLALKLLLDTGVEVDNNEVKKNQRHTTNKKPNMYKDINKDNLR